MQSLLTITKTLPKSPVSLVWVTKTTFLISLPVCTLLTHPHTCCLFSTTVSKQNSKNVPIFVSNIPMALHLIYNKKNSLYNCLWSPTWSGWLTLWLPFYYLPPSSFSSSHNGLLAIPQQSRHTSVLGTLPNTSLCLGHSSLDNSMPTPFLHIIQIPTWQIVLS